MNSEKDTQCDNFFSFTPLKILTFYCLILLFLERRDSPVLYWREFQRTIENLIFGKTTFSDVPNSRWQKDIAPKCERIKYLVAQIFFLNDKQIVLGWMYP